MRVLIKTGHIPAKVDGRLFKISIDALDKYMEKLPTVIEHEQAKAY